MTSCKTGAYLPIRYYSHRDEVRRVILAGIVHVGEETFYRKVDDILRACDIVIYEGKPLVRSGEELQQFDDTWRNLLFDENLDEAFLASIHLQAPQKFMRTHCLTEEVHCFDFSRENWVSGDAEWEREKDGALPDDVWRHIREAIRVFNKSVKFEKVAAAREFLERVGTSTASMRDYIAFRNLHAEAIEEGVMKRIIVDDRDELTFSVFDQIVRNKNPHCVGILFGNGHIPGMDRLLQQRGFVLDTIEWVRALTT